MPLNVKRAGADEYGNTMKVLLAGEPGAGKTRLSSTFPNVFYANIEGGLMSVADRQCPTATITSSADLTELLQILRTSPRTREQALGVQVDTVVIDTLDSYQKMLIEERKANERKDTFAQADWGWLGDQLRMMVRHYRNLPINVIFTCHVKTDKDEETGQTFVRLSLQGAMADEMPAYVDLAVLLSAAPVSKNINGHIERVLQRTMLTGPNTRVGWLKDRSGKLPLEFEVDLTTDYSRMRTAIFGAAIPASVNIGVATTDVAASPTQPPVVVQAEPDKPKKESRAEKAVKAEPVAPKVEELSDAQPVVTETGELLWQYRRDQALFQFSTNVVDLIDWKSRRLYLSMDQWKATMNIDVKALELADQVKSQTWRVTHAYAGRYGAEDERGYGIPLEAFDVVDATGWTVTEKSLPDPEAKTVAERMSPATDVADVPEAAEQNLEHTLQVAEPEPPAPHLTPEPAHQASVADATRPPCEACGGPIETDDLVDISKLRYRRALCKKDLAAANEAKAKKGTK